MQTSKNVKYLIKWKLIQVRQFQKDFFIHELYVNKTQKQENKSVKFDNEFNCDGKSLLLGLILVEILITEVHSLQKKLELAGEVLSQTRSIDELLD